MAKKRILRLLDLSARQRGQRGEDKVEKALRLLENLENLGVPILWERSYPRSRRDRSGVDFELRGKAPLNFRFALDVKSSRKGAEEFQRKNKQFRNHFPKYPFVVYFDEEVEDVALRILRIILDETSEGRGLVRKFIRQTQVQQGGRQ